MKLVALVPLVAGCFFKPDPPAPTIPPGGGGGPAQFAAGDHHACLIDSQQLWCWGDNRSGQLGVTTPEPYTGTPMQVPGMWVAVAAGRAHTCAIDTGSNIQCWGANNARQVTAGTPTAIAGMTQVDLDNANIYPQEIFAAGDASCTITYDGELYCWGTFQPPQTTAYPVTRVEPGNMLADPPHQTWVQLAMSDTHNCALDDFGDVACWGDNSRRQLGDPNPDNRDVATAYIQTQPMKQVSAGSLGTCGIGKDGTLVCWGHATISNANDDSPLNVVDMRTDWTSVAVGADHVCGIHGSDGKVLCYGGDDLAQLGDDFQNVSQFPDSGFFMDATEIFASKRWTCARKADGATFCWGSNQFGEAGNGKVSTAHHPYPTISGKGMIQSVTAGPDHACAVVGPAGMQNEVYCWGWNAYGEIMTAATEFFPTPTDTMHEAYGAATDHVVSAGDGHTCIRAVGNALECWGLNGDGQLGNTAGPFTPDQLAITGTSLQWLDFSAGGHATCATVKSSTSTGDVWCWGSRGGTNGVATMVKAGVVGVSLGDIEAVFEGGPTTNEVSMSDPAVGCFDQATPVASVVGGENRQVATTQRGDGHACAEILDVAPAVLECWGDNGHDQVTSAGGGCVEPTPVVFPNSQPVKSWNGAVAPTVVSVGGNHSCALTENENKLFCWGDNTSEAVGETSFGVDTVSSPTLATSDSSATWIEVATAATYTCAITFDQQTLYCWGLNDRGQVGNGERFPSSPPKDPVAIPPM